MGAEQSEILTADEGYSIFFRYLLAATELNEEIILEQILLLSKKIEACEYVRIWVHGPEMAKLINRDPSKAIAIISTGVNFLEKVIEKSIGAEVTLDYLILVATITTFTFITMNINAYFILTFNKVSDKFDRFLTLLSLLMQMPGVGSNQGSKYWCAKESDLAIHEIARFCLLRLLHSCLNVNIFRPDTAKKHPIKIKDFPTAWFIKSVCNEARLFIDSTRQNYVVAIRERILRLVWSVLAHVLVFEDDLPGAFKDVSCAAIESSILGSRYQVGTDPEILRSTCEYATEALTYLYVIALNSSELTEKFHGVKHLIVSLLNSMQVAYEFHGVSFIHSLIIGIMMLFLRHEHHARCLNESMNPDWLTCTLKPHSGTIADFLVEIMCQFGQTPSLASSVASLLHMIAPHINEFSMFAAKCVMKMFLNISGIVKNSKQVPLAKTFCEMFAEMMQKRPITNVNFAVLIARNGAVFKKLKSVDALKEPIRLIMKYIKALGNESKQENTDKTVTITGDQAIEIIRNIDTAQVFPTPTTYSPHVHVFSGSMASTWSEWCRALFLRGGSFEYNSLVKGETQ